MNRNVFWFRNDIVILLYSENTTTGCNVFLNFVTSKAYLEWPSVQRSVGTEITPRRAKFASQAARLTLTSK